MRPADLRQAYPDHARTTLVAPVTGYVAKRTVQLGQRLQPGTATMAVIPLDQVWIDANFKETQLRDMRIGQPVEISADLYGSAVTQRYPSTASAQHRQRLRPTGAERHGQLDQDRSAAVPVFVNPEQLKDHPHRPVHRGRGQPRDQSGPTLAQQPPQKASYTTEVYDRQLGEAIP